MAIVEKFELEPEKLKSRDVEYALSRTHYDFRRWLMVPNVSWGLMPWECDVLAMSKGGYLHEIEIKVCPYDLKADAKKMKFVLGWRYMNMLREFYYAAPDYVWEKTGYDAVPDDVGIMSINQTARSMSQWVVKVRGCKPNKSALRMDEKQRFTLARLGAMRYWSRMKDCRRKHPYAKEKDNSQTG